MTITPETITKPSTMRSLLWHELQTPTDMHRARETVARVLPPKRPAMYDMQQFPIYGYLQTNN